MVSSDLKLKQCLTKTDTKTSQKILIHKIINNNGLYPAMYCCSTVKLYWYEITLKIQPLDEIYKSCQNLRSLGAFTCVFKLN